MVCSFKMRVAVIADADMGCSRITMVAHTVTQYAQSGIVMCYIQDLPRVKQQVISSEEFVPCVHATIIAQDTIPGGSDFVIVDWTDSAQVDGLHHPNHCVEFRCGRAGCGLLPLSCPTSSCGA